MGSKYAPRLAYVVPWKPTLLTGSYSDIVIDQICVVLT